MEIAGFVGANIQELSDVLPKHLTTTDQLGTSRWVLFGLACAVTIPMVAFYVLSGRVHNHLIPALNEKLGETCSISAIEAGLLGTIRFTDLTVGRSLRVDTLEAHFGYADLAGGHARPNRIVISHPVVRVHANRLEDLLREHFNTSNADHKHHANHKNGATLTVRYSPGASQGRWLQALEVHGGELWFHFPNGHLHVAELDAHSLGDTLRVSSKSASGQIRLSSQTTVSASFGRNALDLEHATLHPRRFVGLNGSVDVKRGHTTTKLAHASVRYGLDRSAPGKIRGSAQTFDGRGSIRFEASAKRNPSLAFSLQVILQSMPAFVLAPAISVAHFQESRATGTMLFAVEESGRIEAKFDLATNMKLVHPWLAQDPVIFNAQANVLAHANFADRTASITRGQIRVGDVDTTVDGSYRWNEKQRGHIGDLTVRLKQTPCRHVLSAIPAALKNNLSGLTTRGKVAATMSVAFDSRNAKETELSANVNLSRCRVTKEARMGDPAKLRRKRFKHQFPDGSRGIVGPGHQHYLALSSLPHAHLVNAFVAAEDNRFFHHKGFDLRQLERSLAVNIERNQLIRGGSTITQQLVKNVYLTPQKTIARKFQEAILTWRLESRLPKKRILEVYFNIIELGPGVFGVGAASRYWFNKPPQQLSIRETAFLAALTPAPRTFSAQIRQAGNIESVMGRRIAVILRHMRKNRFISPGQLATAKLQRVTWRPLRLAHNAR